MHVLFGSPSSYSYNFVLNHAAKMLQICFMATNNFSMGSRAGTSPRVPNVIECVNKKKNSKQIEQSSMWLACILSINCHRILPNHFCVHPWHVCMGRVRKWKKLTNDCDMSRLTTKPTKWHMRPAKTQISLGIHPVWSDSSLSASWVAKDLMILHADSEDWSDWADAQADLSIRWAHMPLCWFWREAAHITIIY